MVFDWVISIHLPWGQKISGNFQHIIMRVMGKITKNCDAGKDFAENLQSFS